MPIRILVALFLGAAFSVPVAAQPRSNTAPDHNAPAQFDSQAPSRDQNLSDRLNHSDGVIRPRNVDPEMHVPPPATGDGMPIVPAPGTSAGDPTLKPK
jgi:hypothetical protein